MDNGKRQIGQRTVSGWLLCAVLLTASHAADAQILGSNLIQNPGAEIGPAGTALTTIVKSIPSWTVNASANVLPYNLKGLLQTTDPAPADHQFNYFISGPSNLGLTSTFAQTIDVSSATSAIATGNVKFIASAFLGSAAGAGLAPPAQMAVAFQNANGQTFSTITVGPTKYAANGMSQQAQIGLVPIGTSKVTVTLTLNTVCENAAACGYGTADSLSLVLNMLGTPPVSILGTNLISNGTAEAGAGAPAPGTALTIPGWSSANGASVAVYGTSGFIQTTDPGPADRGVNLFAGGLSGANIYQDIDVSSAASLIDTGGVTYEVAGWLGGLSQRTSPTLTYIFYDWTGKPLAPTAQLGPTPSHLAAALYETSNSAVLPAGTRRVNISITFPNSAYFADDIEFTLAAPSGPPVITPGGIVSASAFGGFTSISPGSWIEIYGLNLGATTQSWGNSDFTNGVGPNTLAGVSVSVGGKPAFVDYVSPGQVNALVSSDTPFTGPASITVTNSIGTSDPFPIYVNQTQGGFLAPPSFTIAGKQYVGAVYSDGGTFTLPANAIPGVPSHAANVGDTIIIYGVGFGPVNPTIPAGTIAGSQNALTTPIQIFFGTTQAQVPYYGLTPGFTGLYQFNVVVPKVAANNATPITFSLGSVKSTQTLYIAVAN